jgi:adenylosuccinate synthase
MLQHADVVIDLQAGDTGKGKVSNFLLKHTPYDAVIRFNGGANAGHTMYHNGVKVVTHLLPAGVLHNVPCIIGPGCVVDFHKLKEEINMIRELGIIPTVYVDYRAHVTLPAHIAEDKKDTTIGTTRQGIGPTYRDKVARVGVRVEDVVKFNSSASPYDMCDIYDMLYSKNSTIKNILCEGAQGFQLDIDFGDYPYVTSSNCTIGAVCTNGIAPRYLRRVYGVMKAYETYSGFKDFAGETTDQTHFEKIGALGGEIGATTGRKRQIRWLHLDDVIKAMYINNVTDLIINKIDILEQIGVFVCISNDKRYTFNSADEFKRFVEETITNNYLHSHNVVWSSSPETV